jgi:hypothetical protein
MPDLHHHHHFADDDLVNAETQHEKSDVNVRALGGFMIAFIVFAIVTHFALWVLFRQYVKIERRKQIPPLTAIEQGGSVPPLPRLQPFPTELTPNNVVPPYRNTPVTDMVDMGTEQKAYLNSYGWVDKQKGVVHIPIAQAKQLALQRGVFKALEAPAAAPAPAPAQVPNPAGNSAP